MAKTEIGAKTKNRGSVSSTVSSMEKRRGMSPGIAQTLNKCRRIKSRANPQPLHQQTPREVNTHLRPISAATILPHLSWIELHPNTPFHSGLHILPKLLTGLEPNSATTASKQLADRGKPHLHKP
jgi:hypothetical protein